MVKTHEGRGNSIRATKISLIKTNTQDGNSYI